MRLAHATNVVALVTLILLSFPVPASASGFCGDRVARDYEKPLKQTRHIHRIPASHRIPFGPGRIDFKTTGLTRLLILEPV